MCYVVEVWMEEDVRVVVVVVGGEVKLEEGGKGEEVE